MKEYRKVMALAIIGLFIGTNCSSMEAGNTVEKDEVMSISQMPPPCQIIYPTGGEELHGSVTIIWDNYDEYFNNIEIHYYGSDTHNLLGVGIQSAGRHQRIWDTTTIKDGTYKIKVNCWIGAEYVGYDESGWFTIRNGPYPPNTPTGPSDGRPGIEYTFSTSTSHPRNKDVKYQFDWDDGSSTEWIGYVEPGVSINATHTWNAPGQYMVKVKAKDNDNRESEWSQPLPVHIVNDPPEKPTLTGPSEGKTGNVYWFNVTTSDPQGDEIYFLFDWYTEVETEWRGPYESGEMCSATHVFHEDGSYVVKVKAKDSFGDESEWARLQIEMPKTKWEKSLLFNFFEYYLQLFPSLINLNFF